MKRFYIVGVVLLAVSAFGVLTAASASAATFLLAEWLVGGSPVTAELTTETMGELLLEDTKAPIIGKAAVLCSGILDGWVGPNSLDHVSEVLTLTGGEVNKTVLSTTGPAGLTCTAQTGCEAPVTAWAVNLGWETEVELMEDSGTFFANLLTSKEGAKTVGWSITCDVLGTLIEDECTTTEGVAELTLSGTTLLGVFSEAFTELAGLKLAECTEGGPESGIVEGEGTMIRGAEEFTASSEGVIS